MAKIEGIIRDLGVVEVTVARSEEVLRYHESPHGYAMIAASRHDAAEDETTFVLLERSLHHATCL